MSVFQLAPDHVWKATPGCRILVVDNGALRCDIPSDWTVYAPRRHVFVVDQLPPDEHCLIALSSRRVSPEVLAIPLEDILTEWIQTEERTILERSDFVRIRRWPLSAVWVQLRIVDAESGKERVTRICAGHADGTHVLIVSDFESGYETSADAVWETLIGTLVVGEYIEDATTGRKRMKRG